MSRCWYLSALAAVLLTSPASGQLPAEDRVRLAETRRLARAIQDSVWPGWDTAPFAILLVTESLEFLVWHPRPSPDFRAVGFDSLLGSDVLARARTFPPNLLATFPAVGGVPTIVVGQPARTGKKSTAWVLTLLHEHFHQLQTSRSGYYAAVDSHQQAGGDQTGMWMLNYPFPYDSLPVQRRFAALSVALAAALVDSSTRAATLRPYAAARRDLRAALGDADARYFAFQLWQEGVARYVEYACARVAARGYTPSASFTALRDYVPYAEVATRLHEQVLGELRAPDLAANRRVSFYPVGAATALLLEGRTPRWREQYLARLLTLEPEVDALVGQYR